MLSIRLALARSEASASPDRHLDDYWDEDSQEASSRAQPATTQRKADAPPGDAAPAGPQAVLSTPVTAPKATQSNLLSQALKSCNPYREGLLLAFVAFFIFNIFKGRRANKRIAVAWTKAFCDQGGIFDRNFAQLGKFVAQLPHKKTSVLYVSLFAYTIELAVLYAGSLKMPARACNYLKPWPASCRC